MTNIRFAAALGACVLACLAGAAEDPNPQKILLWPVGAPGAAAGGEETVRITEQGERVVSNVHRPSLAIYLPKAQRASAAVIVVPGGGHRELWTDHEGHNVARFLQEQGIAAFVLQYRLARAPGSTYTIDGDALNDLKRAIQTVRTRAAEWSLDAAKIGVIGFSAGGQLAALSATRFSADDRAATRPDFVALFYPGAWPDLKIDVDTPPMYLLCGSDDRPEVIAGIRRIYLSLRDAKVPAELHIYGMVGHGFGLRSGNIGPTALWPQEFVDWMRKLGFVAGEKQ